MEELIALLIQLIIEVGLQLFGSIGFDFATSSRSSNEKSNEKDDRGWGWLVAFAVIGGICGGLSLIVRPDLILKKLYLRIANLIVSPLIAGGLSYLFAAYVWSPKGTTPRHHFWRGVCFALCFGIVRFAYAHR